MSHVVLRRLTGHPSYDEALDRVRAGDPRKVLLTGDGLPLYEVSSPLVHDGIEDTYEDDPDLVGLDVRLFDFTGWARSGAALAIEETITGAIAGRPGNTRRR